MKKQVNNIGQKIKEKRLALEWSQERLAKATGYSRVYVLRLEKGYVKSPGIKALEKISRCLGMKMEELWK